MDLNTVFHLSCTSLTAMNVVTKTDMMNSNMSCRWKIQSECYFMSLSRHYFVLLLSQMSIFVKELDNMLIRIIHLNVGYSSTHDIYMPFSLWTGQDVILT